MAANKKRRRKRNPEKTLLRKELTAWRDRAMERAGHKCEWCSIDGKGLNCHHIIDKRYKPLRTSDHNSVILCPKCHKFHIGLAAHNNPIRMSEWLRKYRPSSWMVLAEHSDLNWQENIC